MFLAGIFFWEFDCSFAFVITWEKYIKCTSYISSPDHPIARFIISLINRVWPAIQEKWNPESVLKVDCDESKKYNKFNVQT